MKKIKKIKLNEKIFIFSVFLLFSIFYFLFSAAHKAWAQFNLPNIGSMKPTVSLNSDPLTPLPDSTVVVTANLSGLTGGSSNYAWFLNGVKQNGAPNSNKNTLTFKTSAAGSVYRVGVNIQTPSGELSDVINITVGDVYLTWTASSRAPELYRAKIMPAQNSLVEISAMPFIYRPGTRTLIASSNLKYNWAVDGKIDQENSGLNKSSYVLRVNNFPGSSYLIRLEIKTEDGAVSLSKDALIPVAKPQVFLYFSDRKTGLPFGAALRSLTIKPASLDFAAESYFFTAPEKSLKWRWFVNNSEVSSLTGTEKPWIAALNLADNFFDNFSAQIKVTAQNPFNELEIAESTTNLEIK